MTLNRTALLVTTLLLAAAGQATAHAIPRSAEPAAGSILAAAPAEVVIVFTERLEGNFSGLEVRDQAGLRIDRGDAHLDPRDASRLSVGLPPLPPGTYKVTWHAVSVDTHRTEGAYEFTIRP